MTFLKRSGAPLPDHILQSAERIRADADGMSRREFIATASTFGASAATAYGLIGLAAPTAAKAQNAQTGGTVRLRSTLRGMKDPRTFDFNALANFSRGWLEYLVQYNNDGTFSPMLAESWDVSDDATVYTFNLRQNATWNDGSPFTAEDVAFNIERFCEKGFEGNSMASRFAVIVDQDAGRLMDGVVEVVDDKTLRLNLPAPDITLIAAVSDYASAIVPQSYSADTMLTKPVGTGAYLPESYDVGVKGVLTKNPDHTYWKEDAAWLDRIEFIDYGEDPASFLAAAEADEIDAIDVIEGEFVLLFDTIDGWERHETVSAGTILARCNQAAEVDGTTPYADPRVRKALAMAVDNSKVLELAYSGQGEPAENHHVCPIHPEYADVGAPVFDPEGAAALMAEAGMADFEHDLISLDAGFWRDTGDAMGAQIRDAGIKLKRTIIPSSNFWNSWDKYPFSVTNWNHRPLGIITLAIAYRSGEAWNESAYANPEFDAVVTEALQQPDVEERRELMAVAQKMMVDDGVIIQPYWRSMFNHTKTNLKGCPVHVAQEMRVADIYWEA
ncbi:MAG: ABC transporter substrate-binding protein [Pseudomonadota bacterium]